MVRSELTRQKSQNSTSTGRPRCLSMRSGATLTHGRSRGNGGAGMACAGARMRDEASSASFFEHRRSDFRNFPRSRCSICSCGRLRRVAPSPNPRGRSIFRKLLTVAAVATATLGLTAGAAAQTGELTFKAKATPSDAGTKKKPKNVKVRFTQSLNKPGTTVEFIDLTLGKGLKMSGKGLGDCTVDDLAFEGPAACANDKA